MRGCAEGRADGCTAGPPARRGGETIDRTAGSERVTGLIREDTVAPPPDLSTTSTLNRPDGDQNVHAVTIGGRADHASCTQAGGP
jgi:hypothetical protein